MPGQDNSIPITCACGKKLRAPVTAAGKRMKCPGCGGAIEVPVPMEPAVLPIPAPVLAYHTPTAYVAPSSMWRENNLAVAPQNAPFPMRCVKCNAPLEPGEERRTTMYWQHPAYYATLLLGLLIGALILVCVRQKTEVTAGLCKVHRAKRRNLILIGWLAALAGIGLEVLSVFFMSPGPWKNYGLMPICAILGLVLIIGSLIWAVVAVPAISIKRIKDNWVWFGGLGSEFLTSLPEQGMR